jgi:ABC-type uncharacterized transport system permease subunit
MSSFIQYFNKTTAKMKLGDGIIRAFGSIIAVIIALAIGAAIIAASGINPFFAYAELFKGAFGTVYSFGEILVRSMPLGFTALAFTIAFRGGLVNIGGEGQFYMGALGATLVALFLPSLSSPLLLFLCFLAAIIFGAIWGAIPGFLKAKWNVNEFVNTVLMNYIAIYLVNFLVSGPIRETAQQSNPQTNPFPAASWLPKIIPQTRVTIGFIILITCVIAVYFFLWKTPLGYKIRVIGHNPKAGIYAGINKFSITILNLSIAGSLAALGGAIQVLGIQHRLLANFSPGYGYKGIAVALLGRNNPFGVLIAAIFIAALETGSRSMESYSGVSFYLIDAIEAIILLSILSSDFFATKYLIKKEV